MHYLAVTEPMQNDEIYNTMLAMGAYVQASDDYNYSIVQTAVNYMDKNFTLWLIENGADIYKKNIDGLDSVELAKKNMAYGGTYRLL